MLDILIDDIFSREKVFSYVIEDICSIRNNLTFWLRSDNFRYTWIIEVIPLASQMILAVGSVVTKGQASIMIWYSEKIIEKV